MVWGTESDRQDRQGSPEEAGGELRPKGCAGRGPTQGQGDPGPVRPVHRPGCQRRRGHLLPVGKAYHPSGVHLI